MIIYRQQNWFNQELTADMILAGLIIRSRLHLQIQDLIEIGTIVAPQGLKGELRVKTDSDFPERFEKPGVRWLQIQSHQSPTEVNLLRGKRQPGKNIFIIKLSGIDDRNQAESLRGSKLFALKSDRPQLEEQEYHVSDLIGLEVYHQQTGKSIGIICDVFSAGNDILEIQLHSDNQERQEELAEVEAIPDLSKINRSSRRKKVQKKKHKQQKSNRVLIPFVTEIVPVVDLKSNLIKINPPKGLLNLDLAEESR